ncbi:DinB family protein [Nocardia paucivorans]|uniref:DinB family protein n=1 Tax=Nocardia paucivorans TaxID=114259 RepID=UPI0006853A97|nr:DinB family protein [Nocardia paucivorans]
MLDRNRATLVATARGLSETDARRRLVPSLTTPIGLIKHATVAERVWFQRVLAGIGEHDCDGPATPGDVSFLVGDDETLEEVITAFERACARSREIAAEYDLEVRRRHWRMGTVDLRWIYLHMIAELARHAGHGDILREQIDA